MSALDYLDNNKIARILLPVQGEDQATLACVAHVIAPPFFEALFLPGQLPLAHLDPRTNCQLFFEAGDRSHSVTARIEEIIDASRLRLQAIASSGFVQAREYFRVDTEISLTYRRQCNATEEKIPFHGPVNLSGGGIFFAVRDDVRIKELLDLELFLGDESGACVDAAGQVVRLIELEGGRRGLGVQFREIEPTGRDRVISFCLAEQRRHLQTRIRILDHD